MENEEDYEGVTLRVETVGWPAGLEGVVIKEQIVYNNNGSVSIVGDPIWNADELEVE
jgi:hypothetical protein